MIACAMRTRSFDIAIADLLHLMSIEGFGDIRVGAEWESFLRSFKRTKSGEHDDRKMGVALANLSQTFNAAHPRHPNVHDNCVGLFLSKQFEPGLNAVGRAHLIIWFQEHAQAFARPHFIVNNKDLGEFGRGGHSASAAIEARGMPRAGRRSKKNRRKFIWLSRANG